MQIQTKKRSLADSKYNERRAECEEGLKSLNKALPDAKCLADVSEEDFEKNQLLIENEIVKRRVRHVVTENARVLKSIEALERNDMVLFGKLMTESHDSLRYDYEVTGTELDTLVDEARKIEGVLGSRMTGAGFGGCSVTLIKTEAIDDFIENVGKAYLEKIGYAPSFYISSIEDGGHEIIN